MTEVCLTVGVSLSLVCGYWNTTGQGWLATPGSRHLTRRQLVSVRWSLRQISVTQKQTAGNWAGTV